MILRALSPADLADACALHIANWRSDYRDDLSPQALGDAVEARMAAYWGEVPATALALAARDGQGGFLGFIRIDPADPKGPYVDALHVVAQARGQGVGAALMRQAARDLREMGHDALWLKVMDRNTRARVFYARLGGVESPAFEDRLLGEAVRTRAFRWDGLAVLAGAA